MVNSIDQKLDNLGIRYEQREGFLQAVCNPKGYEGFLKQYPGYLGDHNNYLASEQIIGPMMHRLCSNGSKESVVSELKERGINPGMAESWIGFKGSSVRFFNQHSESYDHNVPLEEIENTPTRKFLREIEKQSFNLIRKYILT